MRFVMDSDERDVYDEHGKAPSVQLTAAGFLQKFRKLYRNRDCGSAAYNRECLRSASSNTRFSVMF